MWGKSLKVWLLHVFNRKFLQGNLTFLRCREMCYVYTGHVACKGIFMVAWPIPFHRMSGSWEKTHCDFSPLPPLFPPFLRPPSHSWTDSCLWPCRMRMLYSYCEPSADHEELLSIFGEKNGLVLWVDQNTWVVYITVVLLGTLVLEKWDANFTWDWLPQLEGVGPANLTTATVYVLTMVLW